MNHPINRKAIRYLRKSVDDYTSINKKWKRISVADRTAFTEKLNINLSKAFSVAKEIEHAK